MNALSVFGTRLLVLGCLATGWLTSVQANEDSTTRPVVAGFERFLEVETVTDVERGLLLINELNCTSCHAQESNIWATPPRQAPILSQVGQRMQHDYVRRLIENPQATKPGTTMPHVLVGKTKSERATIADAITHYLASTGSSYHQPSTNQEINRGQELFHSVGCVACHDPQKKNERLADSIPLVDLDKKYTLSGLSDFLSNPLHVRPSGRMPQFNLNSQDSRSIASYLLRDIKINSAFRYAFYDGDWKQLPEFDSLEPTKTGIAKNFNLGSYPKKNGFGLVFTGYLQIVKEGEFRFRISSDDGSRVLVDGQKVAEIDGIHPTQSNEGKIKLASGMHKIRIEYFEAAGGESLDCVVEGPGLGPATLQSLMTLEPIPDPNRVASIQVDEVKAALGRDYFASVGCANCHEMATGNGPVATSTLDSPTTLAQLQKPDGCLAGEKINFALDEVQVASIQAALEWLRKPGDTSSITANDRIHQQMTALNCYACHSRETGKRGSADFRLYGGVVDATGGESLETFGRDEWFTGTEAEMGDEGRHPPYLKAIGAKLKPEWLREVLTNPPKDRPYVKTMMPKFGMENMPSLVEDFVEADQLDNKAVLAIKEATPAMKEHGRFFVGTDGLSCIKCHTFGNQFSIGIPAISLTTMTKRLNKDWFQAYMLQPSLFRRGTRMPESWPDGQSFFKDRLDGDPNQQIHAIWTYLADGTDARQPKGLRKTKMEVVAVDEPRIYRNFIQGAGSRAIGVGYPERLNLAYDADQCRMSLLWQENFIDGGRHWTGRGQGFEPPLGDKLLTLSDKLPFFDGDLEQWPSSTGHIESRSKGIRFRGYDLDDQLRPVFRYEFGSLKITDHPIPQNENDRLSLRRRFTLRGPVGNFRYLAAVGEKIADLGDGRFLIDDYWTTQISKGTSTITQIDGKQALIVEFEDQPQVDFTQDYIW